MIDIDTTKMSERGQVVIPKQIRDFIEAQDNTIFTVYPLDKDTIVLKKLDRPALLAEFRRIRRNVSLKLSAMDVTDAVKKTRKGRSRY